jgi:hypothetical protein
MKLTIANISQSIDDAIFATTVNAIAQQVSRDFAPLWSVQGDLAATRLDLAVANVNATADAIIYVGDASQDPTTGVANAHGYHNTNYGHIPYGFVYLDVCQQYGEVWSCTLSHEVMELLADPTAVLTVTGPAPKGSADATVYYDLEVCDPTQGDSYVINDITVSNFVTKTYFGMTPGPTDSSTNFLKLGLDPFGVRPGGYCQYQDSSGAQQIDGSQITPARRAARVILGTYRRNARRAARLAQPLVSIRKSHKRPVKPGRTHRGASHC